MADPVTRAIFYNLVGQAGGVDATAAVLEGRYGTGCKGTVSKMCSGQIGVTVDAVIAVEDFVGAFPMTNRLFERTGHEAVRAGYLPELAALSTIASGQAHAALFRAMSHLSPGGECVTDQERANVIAEMRTARQVLTDIIKAAEAAG